MTPRSRQWSFFGVPMALASAAFAQMPLPTDSDLRAAYCVGVMQSDITFNNEMLVKIKTHQQLSQTYLPFEISRPLFQIDNTEQLADRPRH